MSINRHHPHKWSLDFRETPRKPADDTEAQRAEKERAKAEWMAANAVKKLPERKVAP